MLEETREHGAARARLAGIPIGVLDLAQDLRLAHDHRVDGRGDPEDVLDRLAPLTQIGHVVDSGSERRPAQGLRVLAPRQLPDEEVEGFQ